MIQFLMAEKKHETKKKNTFDVETSIKAAVNVIFTQIQATQVSNYLESAQWPS